MGQFTFRDDPLGVNVSLTDQTQNRRQARKRARLEGLAMLDVQGVVLAATDEDGDDVVLRAERRGKYGDRFMLTFMNAIGRLAAAQWPPIRRQVLDACMLRLDPVDWRTYGRREIAEDTGASLPSIDRATRELVELGWIIERNRNGVKRFRLNNAAFWNSNAAHHQRLEREGEIDDEPRVQLDPKGKAAKRREAMREHTAKGRAKTKAALEKAGAAEPPRKPGRKPASAAKPEPASATAVHAAETSRHKGKPVPPDVAEAIGALKRGQGSGRKRAG